ncbi:MAG: alpha/beta hydrolase [Pseudomonadota bacterium]|uniref:alpha/beta fold hydrolase n=1 Tax=Burkholderiaceae TaxID=119060 RepID=UPI0010F8D8DD|nr:alpha/beta hydrolase [Burkholderia sp. 4M9327F10]
MKRDAIQVQADETVAPFEPQEFWKTFRHGTASVKGVRLHYVEGGQGAPVLLIPGWPQSWYAWRYVMPLLVEAGRRVIALDPRGMGDSDHPTSGYDMRTAAADVHGVAEALGLTADGPIDVVGHDVGTWIGYTYAADWRADVKRLAVFDSALPGISQLTAGIPSEEANLKTWQFAFNRLPDLPEILLQGREREFLSWLFRVKSVHPWAIGAADLDEYVRVNSAPGAIRTAMAYYRHQFSQQGMEESRQRGERKLDIPVLAFGAESGVGSMLFDTMQLVAEDVRGGVVTGCGHYMPEEAPRAVARQVLDFLAS